VLPVADVICHWITIFGAETGSMHVLERGVLGGDRRRQDLQCSQGRRSGITARHHRLKNLDFQVRDQPRDLFDRLAAPSIGSDHGCVAYFRTQCIGDMWPDFRLKGTLR
jgi:hypothetical protein